MQYEPKSKLVTLLLCWFLGIFGVHRFYNGKIITGVLYLFTGGLWGVGVFVDMILILVNSFKDKQGIPLKNDIPTYVIVIGLVIWLIVMILLFTTGVIGSIFGAIFSGLF